MAYREVIGLARPKKQRTAREDEVREEGRQARLAGKPKDSCPHSDYPSRNAPAWWLEGWLSVEPVVQHREPVVQHGEPEVTIKGEATMWPDDKPMPTAYIHPRAIPCPKCRWLRLPNTGSKAVVVTTYSHDRTLTNFWCRNRHCGYRFWLPSI